MRRVVNFDAICSQTFDMENNIYSTCLNFKPNATFLSYGLVSNGVIAYTRDYLVPKKKKVNPHHYLDLDHLLEKIILFHLPTKRSFDPWKK